MITTSRLRLFITLGTFLATSVLLGALYIYLPNTYHSIDNRIRDFFFVSRGEAPHSNDIVIVDIDEKSLKALGQWPWERTLIAQLLANLSEAEVGIIAMDMIFPEADKTSLTNVAKRLEIPPQMLQEFVHSNQLDESLLYDYDELLGSTVAATPTILGYVFDFEHPNALDAPDIPAIFIEKGYSGTDFLLTPAGVLTNLAVIQQQAYSSGFINNVPDPSGVIRSVPLVMKYDDMVYPSLAFEVIRIMQQVSKVTVNYSQSGIENIEAGDLVIPTDRFGRLHVNFKGPGRSFNYLSAIDILHGDFDPDQVEGKIILVGTSAYGLMDLRATPMDSIMPGVEIHANVIDNILTTEMLHRPNWAEGVDLLSIFALTFVIVVIFSYIPLLYVIPLLGGIAMAFVYGYQHLLFEKHYVLNIIFPVTAFSIGTLAILTIKYFFEVRQKEMIKGKFSQKVSKQVMENLIEDESGNHLRSRDAEVTVYFSDIRSFTTISEQIGSASRLVEFLNFYMTKMVSCIVEREGTIDKFIGDAIMAYWNAPGHVEDHADKAVQAALEQIRQREELSRHTEKTYGFSLDYGIGINTGTVTVGDIGSEGRSDYTIIGDPVNLASRLEGLCKFYGARLIISEYTRNALKEPYVMRELDWVKVKGKDEPVHILEIIPAQFVADVIEDIDDYHDALIDYREGKTQEALEAFRRLFKVSPQPLYKIYIDRCEKVLADTDNTMGAIFEFNEK
jgi:adenylate cyclase